MNNPINEIEMKMEMEFNDRHWYQLTVASIEYPITDTNSL